MPHLLAQVFAFLQPYLWYLALGLLSLLLSHKSQIDAWAEQNPRLAGLMKLVRGLGLDPWLVVQSVALIVKGRLPVKVTAGSRSMPPPPLAMLMLGVSLLLAAPFALTDCAGATPEAKGATAAQEVRLVYSASALVLTELAKLDADWMASLTDPEVAKAAAPTARQISDMLDAVRAELDTARPYVAAGKDAAAAKQAVTKAVAILEQALELLAEVGKKPPPETLEAFGYLRGFLTGGAS